MRERNVRFRVISTIAGTIKLAHATPRIRPVENLEVKVFSKIPKTPRDQSIPIGNSERNSQIRDIGSISSIFRHKG